MALFLLTFCFFALPGYVQQGQVKVAVFEKANPFKNYYSEILLDVEKPNGEPVRLINYKKAKNPTWEELKKFLLSDSTEKIPYQEDRFVCTNFAEALHNNAERAGIRAGFVKISFKNETVGHTVNIFETIDRGRVFIDDTGLTTSAREKLIQQQRRAQRILSASESQNLDTVYQKLLENFLDFAQKCQQDSVAYLKLNEKMGLLPIVWPNIKFDFDFWQKISQERERYFNLVDEYFEELEKTNQEIDQYLAELTGYEKELADFERNLADYNQQKNLFEKRVADYQKTGGDLETWTELKQEEAELNFQYNQLKSQQNQLEKKQEQLEVKRLNLIQKLNLLDKQAQSLNRLAQEIGSCALFASESGTVSEIEIIW